MHVFLKNFTAISNSIVNMNEVNGRKKPAKIVFFPNNFILKTIGMCMFGTVQSPFTAKKIKRKDFVKSKPSILKDYSYGMVGKKIWKLFNIYLVKIPIFRIFLLFC